MARGVRMYECMILYALITPVFLLLCSSHLLRNSLIITKYINPPKDIERETLASLVLPYLILSC